MAQDNLERIYLLKSEGVEAVIKDIDSITSAFTRSSEAKSKLGADPLAAIDADSLKTTNALLSEMVGIQNKLLVSLRGVNIEFSKTNNNVEGFGDASKDASGGLNALSDSAKRMGTNLTGAASGLLKLQTGLNNSSIEDANEVITDLVGKLVLLNKQYAANKAAFGDGSMNGALDQFIERMVDVGLVVKDNAVYMGKSLVPQFTEELNTLAGQVTVTAMSLEDYVKAQMEITSQRGQLVDGIQTLNRTFNPAIPETFSLRIRQLNKEMKLLAAGTDEAIAKQIEIDNLMAANKSAKDDASGKTDAENAKLLEQLDIRKELNDQRIIADARKQQLIDEKTARGNNPVLVGQDKMDAEAWRRQTELEKQNAIQTSETASYYQKLNAELAILRINFRQLATAEEVYGEKGKAMQARAATLNEELVKLDKGLGNNQRSIGDYAKGLLGAGNLVQMFTRQLVRGVGSILIFQVLFEAVSKVGEAIIEATPGTDAYIKKQNELAEAAESTAKAIIEEVDAVQKYIEHIRDLVGMGDAAAQQKIDLQKAVGTVNGQTYKAEIEQLDVVTAKRNRDIEVLAEKKKALQDISKVNTAARGNYDELEKLLNDNPDITTGAINAITGRVSKLKSDGYKPSQLAAKIDEDVIKEQEDINIEQAKLRNQNANDKVALVSKTNAIIYDKNKELNSQLAQLAQDYNIMQEKGEAESVDRLVSGIDRKYAALIAANERAAVEYAKSISLFVPDKGDFAADGKTLTKEAISREYKSIQGLDAFKKFIFTEDAYAKARQGQTADDVSEFRGKQIVAQSGYESGQATTNAGISKSFSEYGQANYGRMAEALTQETNAKKQALKLQHDNQVKFIDDNYQIASEWAAKQKELEVTTANQLQVIDNADYTTRLALATNYFKRITSNSDEASANLIKGLDTDTQIQINKVLTERLRGGISEARADKLIDRYTQKGVILSANATIDNDATKIPKAKQALDSTINESRKADIAVNDATNTGDKVALVDALDRQYEAQHAVNVATADYKLLIGEISQAEHDKLVAEQKLKPTDYTKQIQEGLISIGETLANSYMELLAKQDAYRQEMAQRSLAWNQKVQESEVQSSNEKLAEDKANLIAQQQLSREKAQTDKKRAEQQLLINAAVASSKNLAENLTDDPALFAIDEAVILAQLGIQESMISRAPAYARGLNPIKNLAWVGDGGESELMKIGNSWSVSPNTPTLINSDNLESVTPFSKINNVPGNLGANLTAPRFASPSHTSGASSASSIDIQAHEEAIHNIYGMIGGLTKTLSNINVNYSAKAAQKAGLQASLRSRSI